MLKKWMYRLDDVRLKSKLLLLYLLCIFLPIVITSSVFIHNAVKQIELQKVQEVHSSLRRLELNLKRSFQDAILVSHLINLDNTLMDYLDRPYDSTREYVQAYQEYLQDALIKYQQIYSQIQQITIYTNNATIPSTIFYRPIDGAIQEAVWYREWLSSENDVLVTSYVENGSRYFSVIRELKYFKKANQSTRLLRIDIRLSSLNQIVRDEDIDGWMYLINGRNEIVFSVYSRGLLSGESGVTLFDESGYTQNGAIVVKSPFEGVSLLAGYSVIGVINRGFIDNALKDSVTTLVIMSLFSFALATLIIILILSSLTYRINLLSGHLVMSGDHEFDIIESRAGGDEIGGLIRRYNDMKLRIRELIIDVYEADIQKKALELERKQAELNALHSQLNPHFLFNTLSTIHMHSMVNNDKETAEVVLALSGMLKRLVNWEKEIVTVREELGFINEYLMIQKYRFGDKIEYRIHADPDTLNLPIPMMCYQVFVENGCVHGIETAIGRRFVRLDVEIRDGWLYGRISDNGIGIDDEVLRGILESIGERQQGGKSVGIKNVYRRLQLLYGDGFSFHMESGQSGGCRVCIGIQLQNTREGESDV